MSKFLEALAQRVFDECRRNGVDIGAIGTVRVDPNGFNTEADIERFLECYDAVPS